MDLNSPVSKDTPYMDLGKTEVDHLQAADRVPRQERDDRVRQLPPRPNQGLTRPTRSSRRSPFRTDDLARSGSATVSPASSSATASTG